MSIFSIPVGSIRLRNFYIMASYKYQDYHYVVSISDHDKVSWLELVTRMETEVLSKPDPEEYCLKIIQKLAREKVNNGFEILFFASMIHVATKNNWLPADDDNGIIWGILKAGALPPSADDGNVWEILKGGALQTFSASHSSRADC